MSEQEQEQAAPVKRGRGRPRKHPLVERDPPREQKTYKMRAAPNWHNYDASEEETPDKLKISPHLIPAGMSAQWVTDSVYGQGVPQHRAEFERKGWTPVHQDDFDGQFNGMFMPKDKPGEINVEGLVLMMRPKELTERARKVDKQRAYDQVRIKENAMRGGDLPVSLDPRHPSAISTNRITKTMERIVVPGDE